MYLVIELQCTAAGVSKAFECVYPGRNEADSKYHALLSVAAVSQVPIHAVVMLDERGFVQDNKFYAHGDVYGLGGHVVVELQYDGATLAPIITTHSDKAVAENKYYTVLAAATVSPVPVHSVALLTERGFCVRNDTRKHGEVTT